MEGPYPLARISQYLQGSEKEQFAKSTTQLLLMINLLGLALLDLTIIWVSGNTTQQME